MSILLSIWIVSLASIVGALVYGRIVTNQRRSETIELSQRPVSFSDFMSHELAELKSDMLLLIEGLRPHGVRTIRSGVTMVQRGQEVFISRVYGRIKTEKGRASSFFLKQIAEHQGDRRGRSGLGRL